MTAASRFSPHCRLARTHRSPRRNRAIVATALTVVAGAMMLATTAPRSDAHSQLIASEPLPGQAVGQVDEIRLIFAGEFLIDEGVEVRLERRSDGTPVELATPRTPTATTIETDLIGEFPSAGDYVVRYETEAADEGLRQPNAFAFTYDPTLGDDGGGANVIVLSALIVGGIVLISSAVAIAHQRRQTGSSDTAP